MRSALRPLLRLLALAMVAALCGCTAIFDYLENPDPPLVDTTWANEERSVVSPDTPRDEERTPWASFGPAAERDRDQLEDLDEEEGLGEVVITLGRGVYVLEDTVLLDRAKAVILEGQGPHKTRLVLDSDELRALRIRNAEYVELRGLTVVGHTGGGIFLEKCPDVYVTDMHFAGSMLGLSLRSSVARVGSSVFAGCKVGIRGQKSKIIVRECAFVENWRAIQGDSLDIESCAIVENHDAIPSTLGRSSRIFSCLFGGLEQNLAWQGRPALAAHNLARSRDLGDRLGTYTNKELVQVDAFPNVNLPEEFDVVGVHLALERAKLRGKANPPEKLLDLRRARAEVHAVEALRLLKRNKLEDARKEARIAMRYLGDQPLSEAPEAVVDVATLVEE